MDCVFKISCFKAILCTQRNTENKNHEGLDLFQKHLKDENFLKMNVLLIPMLKDQQLLPNECIHLCMKQGFWVLKH